ncbi:hypothetical protein ACFL54_09300 [Planctomycetota bacterium]
MRITKAILCLFLVYLTMGLSLLGKEDTTRAKMPEWKVDYWGSDNIGLSYEEARGQFGVIFFYPISAKYNNPETGELANDLTKAWVVIQKWAKEHFIDKGLYFQIFTLESTRTCTNQKELQTMVRQMRITIPVASVSKSLWVKCDLMADFRGNEGIKAGVFLIDPYMRIALRKPDDVHEKNFRPLPLKQMTLEVAEYWLDTKAEDIAKADKYFKKKKKWKDAYLIYKPLAEKVKVVDEGKVIAERVKQIENEVRGAILKSLMNLTFKNIAKGMAPMKKTMREFEGTLLADEASRQLAVLKRAKKDAELLDLIRLNVANTFTRLDQKEEAKAIYESLAELHKDDENYQAELALRIAGKYQLTDKQALNPSSSVEEWLEKAGGFFAEAEKLLGGDKTSIQRENATALLLAAAEHYTAAITNSEKELPGTRDQLKAVRTKLFWIASQE